MNRVYYEIPVSGERSIDAEAQRMAEFMDVLSGVSIVRPIETDIDMRDDDPIEYAKKRFLAFNYDNQSTLFLNPGVVDPSQDTEQAQLSFEPFVARGGKRSAHGVFFGKLIVGETGLDVAVKPHVDNPFRTGPNDYFKMKAMTDSGFYTLTPAALLLTDKETNRAYSMTVLEEGLTTLDSIDWTTYFPNISDNPGMQELWREVSEQSAVLHAGGNMSHGDLAARNIAVHPEGAAFFIDWEYANIMGHPPRDAESRYNRSYADLSTLLESMCLPPHASIGGINGLGGKSGIGIFYGKSEDWWQGFNDIFFDQYVHTRLQLAELGNHKGKDKQEINEELTELARSLRDDIQMQQAICASIPPLPSSA